MSMFDDDLVDVPCESCGKDVKVKMREVRISPSVTTIGG
jgi:hypothetical protein